MKMLGLRPVVAAFLLAHAWAVAGSSGSNLEKRRFRLHGVSEIQVLHVDKVAQSVTLEPSRAPTGPTEQPAAGDVGDHVLHDVKKTGKRLNEMKGFESAALSDINGVWNIYLAGLTFHRSYFRTVFACFIPGLIWLLIYFKCIFTPDRQRHHHQMVGSASRNSVGDLVFVFDHPLGPQAESDKNTGVDPNKFLGTVFKGNCEEFPRVQALMARVDREKTPRQRGAQETGGEASSRTLDDEEDTDEVGEEEEEEREVHHRVSQAGISEGLQSFIGINTSSVTLYEVKIALLQDCVQMFAHLGCSLKAFSSIDKDEIYLCCSIEKEELINDFLMQNDTQIQLRPEIVRNLDIKYPEEIADHHVHLYDGPFARYDPKGMVQRLHDCNVIPANDPALVYKCNTHVAGGKSFVGGCERFRIIYKRVSRLWDCDEAVNNGIMLQWFPLHNQGRIEKLVAKWGTFRRLTHFSFFQPVNSIFHYYGARVTFLIAWNGSFAKCLLGLAPIAIFVSAVTFGGVVQANPIGVGFALCLVIWCRVATNLWRQEQHFLIHDWNMSEEAGIVLPTFRGEMRPSTVDLNMQEKYYPHHWAMMWRCFSSCVTGMFCAMVGITTYFWDFLFDGQVSLTGSVLLAVQIKIFEFIYHHMAVHLTELENWKYHRDWVDSFLWKKFIFYAVNSYYPFFYLTVIQGAAQARCPADCMVLLRTKLIQTMCILTALRVVQVVVATTVVNFKMWLEDYQMRRAGLYEPGDEPVASYEEMQAKCGSFKAAEQVEAMLQLMLPLGFVLLFGPTAPFTVVLCLILFAINIRSMGVLLTSSCQRPFPHRSKGIGAWRGVIELLMSMGIVSNGFFLIQYGETFKGTPVLTKCTGILLFVCVCRMVWMVVDTVVPQTDAETELMVKRREHVLYKIAHLHPSNHRSPESVRRASVIQRDADEKASLVRMLLAGDWDQVELFPGATKGITPRTKAAETA